MAVFSIVMNKSFSYRGNTEIFSNRYHFSGTAPANSAAWIAFAGALKNLELSCMPSTVQAVSWYGYNPGSETADFSGVFTSSPGTLTTTGGTLGPGDSAVWVRWSTGETASGTGKQVYLRKYFHPGVFTTATPDVVLPAQKTALLAFAGYMTDGALAGSAKICRPSGTIGITGGASSYLTTRTLKRRGKRPTPS